MRKHYIFLPGWGMEPAVWGRFIQFFKEEEMCSFVDWRNITSLTEIKERASSMIQENRTDSIILIGWSLGALVALDLIKDCPGNVKSIVLFGGTSCFIEKENYPFGWKKRVIQRMKKRLQVEKEEGFLDFYHMMFSVEEREEGHFSDFTHLVQTKFTGDVLSSYLTGLDYLLEQDLRDDVRRLELPTLLLHGEQDSICPPGAAEFIINSTKGQSVLEVIPEAGHLPFYTYPEYCYQRMELFFQQVFV